MAAAIDCDLLILVIDGRKGLQPADVALRAGVGPLLHRTPPARGSRRPWWWSRVSIIPTSGGLGASLRLVGGQGYARGRRPLPVRFPASDAAAHVQHVHGGRPSRETPFGVAEHVLPRSPRNLHRAERTALIRQLQALSGRSKVGRVMTQLGQHGRQVWTNLKSRRKHGAAASPESIRVIADEVGSIATGKPRCLPRRKDR